MCLLKSVSAVLIAVIVSWEAYLVDLLCLWFHSISSLTVCLFASPLSFRERVSAPKGESTSDNSDQTVLSVATTLESPPKQSQGSENSQENLQNGLSKPNYSARSLLKSASISASKCIGVQARKDSEVICFIKCLLMFVHFVTIVH